MALVLGRWHLSPLCLLEGDPWILLDFLISSPRDPRGRASASQAVSVTWQFPTHFPHPFTAGEKRGVAEEAWGSLWAQDRAERGSEHVLQGGT